VPEGSLPFQDCGFPYYKDGVRLVHEQVVLLVRDTLKDQIQFMQVILHDNADFTKIELKNINPIPSPSASIDEPPSDK
jgi:hypothetical protein